VLTDKLAFLDAWVAAHPIADGEPVADKPHRRQIGKLRTRFYGADTEAGVEPYLLYLLQRAAETLDGLKENEAQRVLDELQRLGLEDAVSTGRSYGFARRNNIEVWRAG
jgi:hypothetical protein